MFVCDFDQTLIPVDCDEFVVNYLDPSGKSYNDILHGKGPWFKLVADTVKNNPKYHEALSMVPMDPIVKQCILEFKSEAVIISDCNTYAIKKVLENHGVLHKFRGIYSNHFDLINAGPCLEKHECKRTTCTPNLCKSHVLKQIRADYVVYLGDGANDYCPLESGMVNVALVTGALSKFKINCPHSVWNNATDLKNLLQQFQ